MEILIKTPENCRNDVKKVLKKILKEMLFKNTAVCFLLLDFMKVAL